jgi:RimJ/RimL family protein N-acetyltransferase
MGLDLSIWIGTPRPERLVLEGRHARLEPLDPARHGDDLYALTQASDAGDRHRYLFDSPPANREIFDQWLASRAASEDPLFFAVIDTATGRVEGRQTLMRIDTNHGVIEVGNILWGSGMARTRVATEALYLFARYAFETLGYRRFEWKCDDLNEPSKRAADRFGFVFEGVFRQHMVVKGHNRDTAWFAMIDSDWPRLKAGYEAWLQPENFDEQGQQKRRLRF